MIFVPQMFSSRVVRLVLMRLVCVNEDSSPLIKHLLSLTPGALSFSIFLERLFSAWCRWELGSNLGASLVQTMLFRWEQRRCVQLQDLSLPRAGNREI